MSNLLSVSSSARYAESATRKISQRLVDRFSETHSFTERDLAEGVPQLTEAHLAALYTPTPDRTEEQKQLLSPGDSYIEEIKAADVLVIAAPIYNFGPPAALKSWMDHIVRSGETFTMGEQGPVGSLEDCKTYIMYASGGVPAESPVDFVTPWLKTALGFVGIQSVEVVAANGVSGDPEAIEKAYEQIDALSLP